MLVANSRICSMEIEIFKWWVFNFFNSSDELKSYYVILCFGEEASQHDIFPPSASTSLGIYKEVNDELDKIWVASITNVMKPLHKQNVEGWKIFFPAAV